MILVLEQRFFQASIVRHELMDLNRVPSVPVYDHLIAPELHLCIVLLFDELLACPLLLCTTLCREIRVYLHGR